MRRMFAPKATLALLILAASADADADWDFSASLELQARLFARGAVWSGQASDQGQYSLAARSEIRWRNESGNQRASVIPEIRWDATDPERNQADFGELYWAWEDRSLELLVGANTEFWGVTESVHLVDIINQTDGASDIDGEAKLGQPMVKLLLQRDWGELSVFAMPYFRERTFAGTEGRLRAPMPVDTGRVVYESSDGRDHLDFAIRYSHFFGNVDVGLSAFRGTSREPRLIPSNGILVPHYDQIDQFGIDLQYTGDAWLWKLEAIHRDGYRDTFFAAVGGFEYTFYQIGESAADLGILLEYQYDGRESTEPRVVSDNDVFAGARLALNDVQDTSVLAGVGIDAHSNALFVNVEAERRIGNDYVLALKARAFSNVKNGDPGFGLADDDYVEFRLSRFF